MPVAFVHRPGFASADGGTDHVLNGREAQAAAGDFRLVDRDVEHGQAGDLLDPDIGGAVNAPQDGGDLIGNPQQGVELVAEYLHGDVATHASNEFIESHLDRLRELVGVSGQYLHGALNLFDQHPW